MKKLTDDIIGGAWIIAGIVVVMVVLSWATQPRPVYYGPQSADSYYQSRAQHAEAMEEQSNRYGR